MHAEQAYLFRHALLRDAAYQMQLPGTRGQLHTLALDVIESWLEARGDALLRESVASELVAHATAALGSGGDEGLQSRQLEYLVLAATHAERNFLHDDAIRFHMNVSSHRCATPSRAGESLLRAADMARLTGRTGRALELVEQALVLNADTLHQVRALNMRASLGLRQGRIHQAREDLERALQRLGQDGDPQWRGMTEALLAQLLLHSGSAEAALACMEKALGMITRSGCPQEPFFRCNYAVMLGEVGRYTESLHQLQHVLDKASPVLRRRLAPGVMNNLARAYDGLGQHERHDALCLEAIALARANGDTGLECTACGNLGDRRLEQGRLNDAEPLLERAHSLAREAGNLAPLASALGRLAVLRWRQGRSEEAAELFASAGEKFCSSGDPHGLAIHHAVMACFEVAFSRLDSARSHWAEAVAGLRRCGRPGELEQRRELLRQACDAAGVPPPDEAVP